MRILGCLAAIAVGLCIAEAAGLARLSAGTAFSLGRGIVHSTATLSRRGVAQNRPGGPRVGRGVGHLVGSAGVSGGLLGIRAQECAGSASKIWKNIERPKAGSVLVAHEGEADHFFRQAAVRLSMHLVPQAMIVNTIWG